MKYRFITIEGNIGVGKTTLTTILAERLNARIILESFADNPFLPKFYENPAQYGFQLELFFMAERYKQLQQIQSGTDLFQPVTISDYLFTKSLLFAKVTLSTEEFKLYQRLFHIIYQQLVQPDIIIYLHAGVNKLQSNIRKRQRSYEQHIPDAYLAQIQETYMEYIQQSGLPVLFVDASNANFYQSEAQINTILQALENDDWNGIHYISLPDQ